MIRPSAILCALFATGLLAGPATPQERPARPEAWASDPGLVRTRALSLERADLGALTRPTLELELFDGRRTTATRTRRGATAGGGFTWYGTLDTDPEGYAALAVRDGAVVGVVQERQKLYRVRETRAGGLVLYECTDEAPSGCGLPAEELVLPATRRGSTASTSRSAVGAAPAPSAADGSESTSSTPAVDVLIAWTQEAEDAAGGAAAVRALIDLAVLETNVALQNSQVDLEVRLVHSSRVDYVESGSQATDLDRLQNPSDGFLDEVHAWRDAFGADSVSLFIANDENCGRSYNMSGSASPDFESYAFNLVAWNCATGYFAFAHELGHGFGLDHDRVNTKNIPSRPYAYGFWTPNNQYRTIMGLARWGVTGTRIQYFSNPNLQYNGQVLGIADPSSYSANSARALGENTPVITGWRPSSKVFTLVKPQCALGQSLVASEEVRLGEDITVVLSDPELDIPAGAFPVVVVSGLDADANCAGYPDLNDMIVSMVIYQVGTPWVPDSTSVMNVTLPDVATLLGLDLNVQPLWFDLTLGSVRTGNSQIVTVVP